MVFKPGQSGNPNGRPKDRPWKDALNRALKRVASGDDAQALEKLADKCIAMGLGGDMQAIKEIGDRLEGKPAQQNIHVGDEDGGPIRQKITRVEIVAASDDSSNKPAA